MDLLELEMIVRGLEEGAKQGAKVEELPLPTKPEQSRWEAVVDTLNTHYHEPDLGAARVLYASVAAHDLDGQPVWPMAVAPPGSMKSELITALDGMPRVFLVDAVTPKTFLSGQIPDDKTPTTRAASLLHRIGPSGIVLIPDFSTIQSMKNDERSAVFASLRKIFDGKFSKEFGTAEKVEAWEGRVTVVVGTTPEIDRQRAMNQALGERFVMVRWRRAGLEAAKRAIVQDRNGAHRELRHAVSNLLLNLPNGEVGISATWRDRIVALAEIAVHGRTNVSRHPNTKELLEDPQPESPTRLAQQLCQLAKGSARLDGRAHVSPADFEIAKRAAFDSIPPRRLEVLLAVVEGRTLKIKNSTMRYDVEDLQDLGLLEGANGLTRTCRELFDIVKGATSNLTDSPPRSNEEMNREVGETLRASEPEVPPSI